ncbi:hypothetical protein IKF30_00545 [Candidatus Saccharibacteria bacterium]|nr:hypothetical protein [Candidatus Saccharibacteria bacterium]
MSSERLGGNYGRTRNEKSDWKAEREREVAKKRKIGEIAIGAVAAAIVGVVLAHGMKTSEIMDDEERAKNVKKIEVEGIAFHDGVNARKEPFVDNADPNQLTSIGKEGESVVVDYEGDGYYYFNENDANGGWYGFEAALLSDELLEDNYISQPAANQLKSDEKYGDGTVWFNEKYVTVMVADGAELESMVG